MEISSNGEERIIKVKKRSSKYKREQYITVGKLVKGDTQWLDTYAFRIKSLPRPVAQLGELVSDGLPKRKDDILKQTEIIPSMGTSFAYDLPYRITKFKMIIAYATKPPVTMSSYSGELTEQMLRALSSINNKDRILFEGISAVNDKYGFKMKLSPIILNVWDSKPNSLMQYRELVYVKVNPDEEGSEAIYKKSITDTITNYIKDGVIDWVFKDENGFKRERRTYKSGEVVTKDYYDDNGSLIYKLRKASGTKWQFESYYVNGSKKVECTVDDSIDYIGNTEILEYDNIILGHCFGQGSWEVCDSIVHRSVETDVHHIKYLYELNPIDYFRSFHPGGKLKFEGNLVLGFNSSDTLKNDNAPLSIEHSNHFPINKNISVMDGIWHYFNEDGSTKHTRLYHKGVLLKY